MILIAVLAGVTIYSRSPAQLAKKQVSLGERYLTELNYEQAVAAFKNALTIDPKNAGAREALVQTYLSWADALVNGGDPDGAIRILTDAGSTVEDERLIAKLKEIQALQLADATTDIDDSSENSTESETEDSDIIDINGLQLKPEEPPVLDEMITAVASGDYLAVNSIIEKNSHMFDSIESRMRHLDKEKPGNHYIYGDGDIRFGFYLMRPNLGDPEARVLYGYIGPYAGDSRHGEGLWYSLYYSHLVMEYWKGKWENDMPNGEFLRYEQYDNSVETYTGNVVNGLWDQAVVRTITRNGETDALTGQFSEGVLKPGDYGGDAPTPYAFLNDDGVVSPYFDEMAENTYGLPGYRLAKNER
ncbi:MAG: tetratricopeptide repeat protein [Lachnospiraceae bacterium]|nr:tetratricopeptide repeat protein [Lachnospiraceae bacterium]